MIAVHMHFGDQYTKQSFCVLPVTLKGQIQG